MTDSRGSPTAPLEGPRNSSPFPDLGGATHPEPLRWPLVVYLKPRRGMARILQFHVRRLATLALAASLLAALAPGQDAPSNPDVAAFLDRVEAAWQTRDLQAWLALREFSGPEERTVEEATLRAAFASDEAVFTLPATSHPAAGRGALRGRGPAVHGHEPKARVALLDAARRAARGGMGDRVAAGGEPDGRARPPGSRGRRRFASGTSRCASRTSSSASKTARCSRRRTRSGRRSPPSWAAPACASRPRPRPSASSCVSSAARRHSIAWWAGPSCACTPWTSCARRASACSSPSPTRARGAREADKIFRARSERSFIVDAPLPRSPWWLMPGMGDAVVDFPVRPQARADVRAHLQRGRGREPVRPRPAAADLHLPLERRGAPLQRGRRPQRSTCWSTTSPPASSPSASS